MEAAGFLVLKALPLFVFMLRNLRQWYWRQRLKAFEEWLSQLERADIVLPGRAQIAIEKLFPPALQAEREQNGRRQWRRDAIASLRPEVARLKELLRDSE